MVKLVATDMDGTLLDSSKINEIGYSVPKDFEDRITETIQILKKVR